VYNCEGLGIENAVYVAELATFLKCISLFLFSYSLLSLKHKVLENQLEIAR